MNRPRSVSLERARGSSRSLLGSSRSRASSEGLRTSNAFVNLTRRSSISEGGKRIIKDPRPLSDKAYQRERVTELITFLKDANYAGDLSMTRMMLPSKRDFEQLFQFLYNYWEPQYKVQKIEEEAPKILKNLGYPFPVSKNTFQVITRINFPAVLGILLWFMDLNKFAMPITTDMIFASGEKGDTHLTFLKYVFNTFKSNPIDEKQEDEIFAQMIRRSRKTNLAELLEINQQKKCHLAELEARRDHVKLLIDKKKKLEKNIVEHENYIRKMKGHKGKKAKVIEKLKSEHKEKELELNDLLKAIEEKQAAYNAQGFDGIRRMQHFQSQQKELVSVLEQKKISAEKLQSECWDLDLKVTAATDKLSSACASFNVAYSSTFKKVADLNSMLRTLQTDKTLQEMQLCIELQLPEFEMTPKQASIVEYNKCIKPMLRKFKRKLKKTIKAMERYIQCQKDNLDMLEIKKIELSVRSKQLDAQLSQKRYDADAKKREAKEELAALAGKYDDLVTKTMDAIEEKAQLDKEMEELNKKIAEEENARSENARNFKESSKAILEIVEKCRKLEQGLSDEIEEHKKRMCEKLEELNDI